jgi:hypothetical protein
MTAAGRRAGGMLEGLPDSTDARGGIMAHTEEGSPTTLLDQLANLDPQERRMLGHAKASMTLDIYADMFDDDLDVVADRLDTAIRSTADSQRIESGR